MGKRFSSKHSLHLQVTICIQGSRLVLSRQQKNCRRTLHPPVKQRKCFTTNSTKHTPRKSCDSICLHTQSANVSYCQWMVEVGVCGLTCGANLILLLSKDLVSSPSMQSQNHRPVTPEKQRTQRDASPANVEWCLNKRAIC